MEDTQKFQDVYLPAVDGHNCQLADTQQQGRILGHGVQLFAGPKALEALAKVVLLIGRGVQGIQVAARLEEAAALQRGGKVVQAANKVATGAKAEQAANKVATGAKAEQAVSAAVTGAAKAGQAANKVATGAKAGQAASEVATGAKAGQAANKVATGAKAGQAANKVATGAKAGQAAVQEGKANKPLSIQGPENLYANHPPENLTKLKGDQGWKDKKGNIWKKDRKHNDHWDVTDPKTGKKIKEVDFDGNQIWPDGPKNKNKRK